MASLLKTKRILVTGSRDWEDYNTVARQLAIAFADAWEKGYAKVIVVHGDCPSGADAMAQEFVNKVQGAIHSLQIKAERHPAKWYEHDENCHHQPSKSCPAAGPRRNKQMVDLGADICLAFIKNYSKGATGCAKLAAKSNIEVKYERE